jgi:hypothetical protein
LATLAEAPANSKNITFARNDSLYSLTYYSNDPVLWCSLDSQSYHQLDPELNDHQNLIGIKLFLCHPDFQIHPPEFPFRASPLPNQSSCQTIPSLIMIFLLCKQTTLLFV